MAKATERGLLLKAFEACPAQLFSHRWVILDGVQAVHIHRVSSVAMGLNRPATNQNGGAFESCEADQRLRA